MKVKKAASIPLVLHDPYFSIWSSSDNLYDADTMHWSGKRQKLRGYVTVDKETYSFLGDKEFHIPIEQIAIDVTATATTYFFKNEKIGLKVRFTSPLLLDDPYMVSRPCTYIDFTVEKKTACDVSVNFFVSSDLVQQGNDFVIGHKGECEATEYIPCYKYATMGRAKQRPLGNSGDNITIDWGYVYLASQEKDAVLEFDSKNRRLNCNLKFSEEKEEQGIILAFDDLVSINYFGEWRRGYWTEKYNNILDAIGSAFADRKEVLQRAESLDSDIYERAMKAGGEAYAFLCCMSYRHTIAAHKLVVDENGELLFLSKENDSNGCIGTVDVSYPSVPLFLLYNTEYVKGMLRPIFRFASCAAWEYDFAPHDVGRYPYAWGQVYGLNGENDGKGYRGHDGDVFPPYHIYPKGSNIYDVKYQMPVEECGNMLIMTAVVCMLDKTADFAKEYREILEQWTKYLLEYGSDPGEQLCTDDFAGHLSHNVNLSVKAIMGIEAFARICDMLGEKEKASEYHEKALEMAGSWERRAEAEDHYTLSFGNTDSWSLKYNLIWDKFFESNLFSESVFEKELNYYVKKRNTYGIPLDSRREYTKSDWILWCAAMTDDREKRKQFIEPVASYLENTSTRVPFSDWYETITGEYCHFIARSVQGGIYMPVFIDNRKEIL